MLIYEHSFHPQKHPCHEMSLCAYQGLLASDSYLSGLWVFISGDRRPSVSRPRTGGRMFGGETIKIPINGVKLTDKHTNVSFWTGELGYMSNGGA